MELPATLPIPPERAWQMILGQLQMEMSKSTFGTWVKPVEFVSLRDGVLTLGAHNAYSRDWLDSRLKSTIQRQLLGILNQPVVVKFVVLDDTQVLDDKADDEEDDQDGQHDPDEGDETFFLQSLHESVRNVLIEPERVVKLPVYFLRWLPYVDAEILFLVLALRQEYYITTGGKRSAAGKVAARAERVCQWVGISRAQFFRLMQPGSNFGWFGKKCETEYEVDRRTGRTKKSPNKYTLYGVTITPGDAEDLMNYLRDHGVQENPNAALLAALAAQPRDILQYPVRVPGDEAHSILPKKQTVQDVVREAAGQNLTPDTMDLADQLSDHLLTPNEFVLVTWYFLRHWLPLLGFKASMLVLILRNACYFNEVTGEMRDEVWVDGGYDTLAQRLGLENPCLISHWFPAAIEHGRRKEHFTQTTQREMNRRAQFQERMGNFAQRIDHRKGKNRSYSWKFKVQRSDPLIPDHERVYQRVSKLIFAADQDGLLDELMDWAEVAFKDCFETHINGTKIDLRRSKFLDDCSETLTTRLNDCLATLKMEREDCFETLLKILKGIKDSYFEKDTASNQATSPAAHMRRFQRVMVEVSNPANGWHLSKLLLRAGEKQRLLLEKQEQDAVPFVSWLIHGSSNPKVQSPYSLAISKLVETPRTGAGGACDRLAALPPEKLVSMLQQRISLSQPSSKDWEIAMGNARLDRVRLLADILNLPIDLLEVG